MSLEFDGWGHVSENNVLCTNVFDVCSAIMWTICDELWLWEVCTRGAKTYNYAILLYMAFRCGHASQRVSYGVYTVWMMDSAAVTIAVPPLWTQCSIMYSYSPLNSYNRYSLWKLYKERGLRIQKSKRKGLGLHNIGKNIPWDICYFSNNIVIILQLISCNAHSILENLPCVSYCW